MGTGPELFYNLEIQISTPFLYSISTGIIKLSLVRLI